MILLLLTLYYEISTIDACLALPLIARTIQLHLLSINRHFLSLHNILWVGRIVHYFDAWKLISIWGEETVDSWPYFIVACNVHDIGIIYCSLTIKLWYSLLISPMKSCIRLQSHRLCFVWTRGRLIWVKLEIWLTDGSCWTYRVLMISACLKRTWFHNVSFISSFSWRGWNRSLPSIYSRCHSSGIEAQSFLFSVICQYCKVITIM